MPHLSYGQAFERRPDLVLQDDGIDAMPALHTTESFDVVFTGVVPLVHEQATATSAGLRRELLACGKGLNGIAFSVLFYRSPARRL